MDAAKVVKLYGSGNLTAAAAIYGHLNIRGLSVFDPRGLRPDGAHWDFSILRHRIECRKQIEAENPDWVVGAPPCGPFSSWQNNNVIRMDPEKRRAQLAAGRQHLRCMISI